MTETPISAEDSEEPRRGARPTVWVRLRGPARGEYTLTCAVFLRLLGFVYFCAFGALWPQIPGLLGRQGLLPVADFLAAVAGAGGPPDIWGLPTLAWLSPGDEGLLVICGAGAVLSLLLMLGLLPGPILAALWLLYLSLVNVGQDFLAFQWDILLLEAGFLAIFLAPWQWRMGAAGGGAPSLVVLWLLRLLLFRLMFFSGYVKLASGDPTWRDLTALTYHYWTQPLPNPVAWYMAQLPLAAQQVSVVGVFVAELGAPWLIFAPRPLRLLGAAMLIALQVLIGGTGNYAFFNLLTVALCVLLLDDRVLRRLIPARLARRLAAPDAPPAPRLQALWVGPVALGILVLNAITFVDAFQWPVAVPPALRSAAGYTAPLHLVNSYGLFAVMTTSRPEIVVEGSADGQTWREYGFPAKPGDVTRAPPWVAPYQPRLDWQLWFAVLSGPQATPWFATLLQALQEGRPAVLSLLGTNPFPDHPPRYIRAQLYLYRFTQGLSPAAAGGWWQRTLVQGSGIGDRGSGDGE